MLEMTQEAIEQLHPLVRAIVEARGLSDADAVSRFLEPSYDEHLHDPFLMRDMGKAVNRILLAIDRDERIAVYADFDCDGIPGAALLQNVFDRLEYNNVEIYIPHRSLDGYGLHEGAIATLKERGVKLIITVDVGIAANEAVAYANERGIDVIVTDHHEPSEIQPEALAVVNPKFEPYPDPNLCGAGVAFKLACALIIEGKSKEDARFMRVQEGWEKWLLDLVAIATIADMVPLTGENRVLARYGLLVLRKTPRPGIVALCRALHLTQSELTEDDISFTIAPRINAASKMDETDVALRLLSTRSAKEAEVLAVRLESLNKRRKAQAAAITREVHKRMRERALDGEKVLVLGDPSWQSVMLGPVANSVVKEHGGIVCLWGQDAAGKLKGSCRSDGTLSVVELFRAAESGLEEAGGHHASGGFTVSREQVHHLQDVFREHASTLSLRTREEAADAHEARIEEVAQPLYDALSLCAPFGMGNEKPCFVLKRVIVERMSQFGKTKEHLEVVLKEGEREIRAVQFFASPTQFAFTPTPGERATVLATLDRSVYRGRVELRLRLVDILSPEA